MNKQDILLQLKTLMEMVETLPDHEPVAVGMSIATVTEFRAAELTGYSESTLESRRNIGDLKQGVDWWHDSKGRVIYDLEKLQEYMRCRQQKGNTPACKSEVKQSGSVSRGKAKNESGKPTPRLLHLQG